jgi:PrtD family type I secretion system ABC transporter
MLTGPLFMLQVYDRVLASGSVSTLVALFALVAVLYGFMAAFEFVRSRILSRVGFQLDHDLGEHAGRAWIEAGAEGSANAGKPLTDLATVRKFMSSTGLPALFDLPWVPVYLAIVFLLHSWLGWLATAGAIIVILATVLTELLTKRKLWRATAMENTDVRLADAAHMEGDALVAMGMADRVTAKWRRLHNSGLEIAQKAGGRVESIKAVTKSIRLFIQSAMLALGAYLAILQEITPGTMIAASILAGRALAPVDAAVGNWTGFVTARQAWSRLQGVLGQLKKTLPTSLPAPQGRINLEGVVKLVPSSGNSAAPSAHHNRPPILAGLTFWLEPGDGLGVIGPSASGKSSLARLLTGTWMPDRGTVRLDGATLDQWDRNTLGQHIGYLPQRAQLLPGTVRENISRFDDTVSDEEVVAAAELAGVHELILGLSDGYNTDLSTKMAELSGGQMQRIALARAALRNPALIILDEPNSNLDSEGDTALTLAIKRLREAGSTVIVMAHRPSALASVNKVLMIRDGKQVEFGDKDAVLNIVTQQPIARTQEVKSSNGRNAHTKRIAANTAGQNPFAPDLGKARQT